MSFSGMVKEELFRQIGSARHCKMAELAAMLCSCGKMEYFSGESKLKIQTENEAVARKCFTLLQKTFNIEREVSVRENSHQCLSTIFFSTFVFVYLFLVLENTETLVAIEIS